MPENTPEQQIKFMQNLLRNHATERGWDVPDEIIAEAVATSLLGHFQAVVRTAVGLIEGYAADNASRTPSAQKEILLTIREGNRERTNIPFRVPTDWVPVRGGIIVFEGRIYKITGWEIHNTPDRFTLDRAIPDGQVEAQQVRITVCRGGDVNKPLPDFIKEEDIPVYFREISPD